MSKTEMYAFGNITVNLILVLLFCKIGLAEMDIVNRPSLLSEHKENIIAALENNLKTKSNPIPSMCRYLSVSLFIEESDFFAEYEDDANKPTDVKSVKRSHSFLCSFHQISVNSEIDVSSICFETCSSEGMLYDLKSYKDERNVNRALDSVYCLCYHVTFNENGSKRYNHEYQNWDDDDDLCPVSSAEPCDNAIQEESNKKTINLEETDLQFIESSHQVNENLISEEKCFEVEFSSLLENKHYTEVFTISSNETPHSDEATMGNTIYYGNISTINGPYISQQIKEEFKEETEIVHFLISINANNFFDFKNFVNSSLKGFYTSKKNSCDYIAIKDEVAADFYELSKDMHYSTLIYLDRLINVESMDYELNFEYQDNELNEDADYEADNDNESEFPQNFPNQVLITANSTYEDDQNEIYDLKECETLLIGETNFDLPNTYLLEYNTQKNDKSYSMISFLERMITEEAILDEDKCNISDINDHDLDFMYSTTSTIVNNTLSSVIYINDITDSTNSSSTAEYTSTNEITSTSPDSVYSQSGTETISEATTKIIMETSLPITSVSNSYINENKSSSMNKENITVSLGSTTLNERDTTTTSVFPNTTLLNFKTSTNWTSIRTHTASITTSVSIVTNHTETFSNSDKDTMSSATLTTIVICCAIFIILVITLVVLIKKGYFEFIRYRLLPKIKVEKLPCSNTQNKC